MRSMVGRDLLDMTSLCKPGRGKAQTDMFARSEHVTTKARVGTNAIDGLGTLVRRKSRRKPCNEAA